MFVALAGLGLSVASEQYQTSLYREQERQLLSTGHQFRQALGSYYESQLSAGKREYPASLEELLADKRFPGNRRHLRKIFFDPVTAKQEWGLVRVAGKIVGVYSLSDRPPLKQGNFDDDDISFQGKEKLSDWKFVYPPNLLLQTTTNGEMTSSTSSRQETFEEVRRRDVP